MQKVPVIHVLAFPFQTSILSPLNTTCMGVIWIHYWKLPNGCLDCISIDNFIIPFFLNFGENRFFKIILLFIKDPLSKSLNCKRTQSFFLWIAFIFLKIIFIEVVEKFVVDEAKLGELFKLVIVEDDVVFGLQGVDVLHGWKDSLIDVFIDKLFILIKYNIWLFVLIADFLDQQVWS